MEKATVPRSFVILAATVSTLIFGLPPAAAEEGEATGAEQIRAVAVPDARLETRFDALQKRIPEAVFEEAPLDQVLEWMGTLTPMQILPRWKTLEAAGIERDKPISMSLRGLKLCQVLWMVLREASGPDLELSFEASGEELLIVSTFEDLEREQFLLIYDVRSLLDGSASCHKRHAQREAQQCAPTAVATATGGSPQAAATDEAQNQRPVAPPLCAATTYSCSQRSRCVTDDPPQEGLPGLLIHTVRPDSWVENGGRGTARCFNGLLVVRQSRSVHREIEALLNALLEAGATEIEPQ